MKVGPNKATLLGLTIVVLLAIGYFLYSRLSLKCPEASEARVMEQLWDFDRRFNWAPKEEQKLQAIAIGSNTDSCVTKALIEALDSDHSGIRSAAHSALRELPPQAVGSLFPELNHKSMLVRQIVAELLGSIGDRRAVEPLIRVLKDSTSVQVTAAKSLGEIGDARATTPLIEALRDPSKALRSAAARSLGLIRDPLAVEPLIAALKDSEPHVREEATAALGPFPDSRCVEALVALFKDPDRDVRSAAAVSLWVIGTDAVEAVVAALSNKDSEVRRCSVHALGCRDDPRVVEALFGSLKDSDFEVRSVSETNLVCIGNPRIVEHLIGKMDSAQDEERDGATGALGKLVARDKGSADYPRILQLLMRAMKDRSRSVRISAAYALGDLREASLEKAMYDSVKNQDWDVCAGIIYGNGLAHSVKDLLSLGGLVPMEVRQSALKELHEWSSKLSTSRLELIAKHYDAIIRDGDGFGNGAFMETELIESLNGIHGNRGMAQAFLNSGNDRLINAGNEWAAKRDYLIVSRHGGSVRWGQH